jgi:hypothetical protein
MTFAAMTILEALALPEKLGHRAPLTGTSILTLKFGMITFKASPP